MTSIRVIQSAILCALLAISIQAQGLRHGIANEEFTGDVVVMSLSPYKIIMGIDSAANGRDSNVDVVFGVTSETKFTEKVSMRLDNAHVVVAADFVMAKANDGRVVVFTVDEQCAACSFATNDTLYRFAGYQVVRRADPMRPFKSQKKTKTGATAGPRTVAPNDSQYYEDLPVDYWDPCSPDPWGNTPAICDQNIKPPQDCQAGGNGAVSCGLTGCVALFGTSPGCNITCGAGFYACCYCSGGVSNCNCYKVQ